MTDVQNCPLTHIHEHVLTQMHVGKLIAPMAHIAATGPPREAASQPGLPCPMHHQRKRMMTAQLRATALTNKRTVSSSADEPRKPTSPSTNSLRLGFDHQQIKSRRRVKIPTLRGIWYPNGSSGDVLLAPFGQPEVCSTMQEKIPASTKWKTRTRSRKLSCNLCTYTHIHVNNVCASCTDTK